MRRALGLLAVAAAACSSAGESEPPEHTATVVQAATPAGRVRYSWRSLRGTQLLSGPSFAYDTARERLLVRDGPVVHERGPAGWVQHDSTEQVPYGESAFDAVREELVVFGGLPDTSSSLSTDATWVWRGTWQQRFPAVSPSPRRCGHLVWEAARKRVLLVGGETSAGGASDAWSWDGATWTPLPAAPAAVGCDAHLIYDSRRAVTVALQSLTALWEFSGTGWRKPVVAANPAMFSTVLFDDDVGAIVALDSGLAWNGQTWRSVEAASTNTAAIPWHAAVYDAQRHRRLVASATPTFGAS